MRGFTLIETLLYIALYSFIMSAVLLSVYGMMQSGDRFSARNQAMNEGTFVTQKMAWALTGVSTISSPTSNSASSLTVTRYDGTNVRVRLTSGKIEMSTDGGTTYTALTTDNVTVTSLNFGYLSGTPAGIEASTTINGITFMTRRYIQQ